MRTDGQIDMKKLIVAFRNFARASKTYSHFEWTCYPVLFERTPFIHSLDSKMLKITDISEVLAAASFTVHFEREVLPRRQYGGPLWTAVTSKSSLKKPTVWGSSLLNVYWLCKLWRLNCFRCLHSTDGPVVGEMLAEAKLTYRCVAGCRDELICLLRWRSCRHYCCWWQWRHRTLLCCSFGFPVKK